MLQIKMLRMEIQMERENNIHQLQEMEKRKITHPVISYILYPLHSLSMRPKYLYSGFL